MANEVRVHSSLQIQVGNVDYQSRPTSFVADLEETFGPAPGAFMASTDGTDVDFTELGVPGLCWIQNQDADNYIIVGIWDITNSIFFPVLELLPGESYVLRLSRALEYEFAGTGTGTPAGGNNRLRIKGTNAPCKVVVNAFNADTSTF